MGETQAQNSSDAVQSGRLVENKTYNVHVNIQKLSILLLE